MTKSDRYDVEKLRRVVEEDAGCPEFPALAEAERRAGRAEEAHRISREGLARSPGRLAGRVSLGLALLELGDVDAARRELAEILDSALEPHLRTAGSSSVVQAEELAVADFSGTVADAELDEAFEAAESQTDEMFSANRMAEQVLMDRNLLDGEQAEDLEMGAGSAYSTETMAGLLEQQGDRAGAEAIRRSIEAGHAAAPVSPSAGEGAWPGSADAAVVPVQGAPMAADGEDVQRDRVLGTLETWLHNLQRGTA